MQNVGPVRICALFGELNGWMVDKFDKYKVELCHKCSMIIAMGTPRCQVQGIGIWSEVNFLKSSDDFHPAVDGQNVK